MIGGGAIGRQYEFVNYGKDAGGSESREFYTLRSDSSARAKAGRLAKTIDGPVDLAIAGSADWNERYITTASPSEFHSSGYQFARLT